jgi:hypothetical protein
MSVERPLPGFLLIFSVGCVHTAPCTTVTAPEPSATPSPSAAAPPAPVVLLDVAWQLRSGDGASWANVPLALYTFSAGRWECALGEVLPDDTLTADALELLRTRRLACTHATGATVQTQLACAVHTERAPASRPTATEHTRELQLQLDATPAVHVRCMPAEVQELSLLSRDKRTVAVLCARAGGIDECTKTAGGQATSAPVAPTSP